MPSGKYKHPKQCGFQKGHKFYLNIKPENRKGGQKGKSGVYKRTIKSKNTLGKHWKVKDTSNMRGRYPSNGFKNGHIPWSKKNKGKYKLWPNGRSDEFKKIMRDAHSGEKCYFWKGGISFEPYSIDWTKTLKKSIRERDKYTCRLCGKEQEDIIFAVHHIDYNKKNCNPNNLITLCRSCHSKTNINREYWAKEIKIQMFNNFEEI